MLILVVIIPLPHSTQTVDTRCVNIVQISDLLSVSVPMEPSYVLGAIVAATAVSMSSIALGTIGAFRQNGDVMASGTVGEKKKSWDVVSVN